MDRLFLVSFGAGWLLVIALGLVLAVVLRVLGEIHLKGPLGHHALITDEGPALHHVMPEFTGQDARGRPISLRDYRGRELVVLFLSATCGPCEELLRVIRSTRQGLIACPEFIAILEVPSVQAEWYVRHYGLDFPVILDQSGGIRAELGIVRIPYGLLVDQDGVVRMKGVTNGRRQLEGLIAGRGNYLNNAAWQVSHSGSTPDR